MSSRASHGGVPCFQLALTKTRMPRHPALAIVLRAIVRYGFGFSVVTSTGWNFQISSEYRVTEPSREPPECSAGRNSALSTFGRREDRGETPAGLTHFRYPSGLQPDRTKPTKGGMSLRDLVCYGGAVTNPYHALGIMGMAEGGKEAVDTTRSK
uniref:Uncharacterized protein n=1 Tax=Anopheles coluzzii TaxID=1518534 RepID=A0A8W7PJJ6_ANOCL